MDKPTFRHVNLKMTLMKEMNGPHDVPPLLPNTLSMNAMRQNVFCLFRASRAFLQSSLTRYHVSGLDTLDNP